MRNALVGGYFWVIVCIQFFSVIIIGFLICAISKKRSRDAYGVAKYAYLPFIPLGFLWLLFMPPKNRTISGIKSTPFMRGWGGVFTGVSLLIASGVAANSTKEAVQRFAQQVSQDPALDQAGFEMRIYSRGIDAILTELASGFQTPHRVDNETVLKSVVADGSTLRYTYETAAAIAALPAPYKTDLKRRNCVAPLMPVINAGATMEHVYTRPDGSLIDRLRFDTRTCN
ncbi:hypothetical protein T281_10060 [Rhodomicrobium udaipurense JA643]|nr:hypothetical protein T281_10060 [Rhodomicrobium udaipurense JA643]